MKKDTTQIVRKTLDEVTRHTISPERKACFDAIRDEDIDYSDIHELPDDTEWWRGGVLSEKGQEVTALPLDSDVLVFFGNGRTEFAGRVNSVLRDYMLAHADETAPVARAG